MRTCLQIEFPVDMPDPKALTADNEVLSNAGRRVMVRRDCHTGTFSLFVEEKGVIHAGWVLAVAWVILCLVSR